jgi:predicted HTH transcriptional regulator
MRRSHKEHEMNQLSAILGYPTFIPDAPVTRSNRIGVYGTNYQRDYSKDAEIAKRREINKEKRDPNALKDSEKRILSIVKRNNGTTGMDVSKKTKWTSNHCSLILTALYRKGLLKREKQSANGTRWYTYFYKEQS